MTAFNIKIISDNVCPFCHLGKARLDRAITSIRQPSDTFTITWHAFRLNPTPPPQSEPVSSYLARKFGAGRADQMHAHLKQIGAAEGLNFTFQGRVGDTRDSHRVVALAKAKAAQGLEGPEESRVVGEVMKMYFEEGGDITSHDDLVGAASKAGLDAEETRAWLREGKGGQEVDAEFEASRRMGVTGVPHFVINGKWEVHGAQDVDEFVRQLEKARGA